MGYFRRVAVIWLGWTLAALLLIYATLWRGTGDTPPETAAAAPLPALGAKIDETTVSGISSGAYMAGQFEMAHARIVSGAAIIAGGPYGCSESVFSGIPGPGSSLLNLTKAVNGCMLDLLDIWGVGNGAALARKAEQRAADGEIDPIADVVTDRVYLFSGSSDTTVMPSVVRHAVDFYKALGVPDANIKDVTNLPAGHAFVTDDAGSYCEHSGEPYVVDCDYDQAGELLKFLLGPLNARAAAPSGRFITFDQRPFSGTNRDIGLADSGVVYVPAACSEKPGCRVHIAFHGCAQNQAAVGDAFIKESGFARWADTNRLIILFPQVAKEARNPQGCWDWWGYTGPEYLTRSAPQIVAVKAMLDTLHKYGAGA